MLAYFPEVMREYDILSFDVVTPGGLTNRRVVTRVEQAYLSRKDGGQEGIVTSARTENQKATFYVEGDESLRGFIPQGLYVEDDGELYTFVKDNGFALEGAYHAYGLQLVTGPKQQPALPKGTVNLTKDFE
jgi:hypothetical protein